MYRSEALTNEEYETLIKTIREGYADSTGTLKPNSQVADILVLEANLGRRIGDIVKLNLSDFKKVSGSWNIEIVEKKTKKRHLFPVSTQVHDFIEEVAGRCYADGDRLFSIGAAAVWKVMRKATAHLGWTDVSTHSLRKKAGLDLLDATNGDYAAVCTYYGHSSLKTTTEYLRRSPNYMREAVEKVSNIV